MEKKEKVKAWKRLREFLTIEDEEFKDDEESDNNGKRLQKGDGPDPIISKWVKEEQGKLLQFSKTGIVVLSLLLVLFGFYSFGTWSIATSSHSERKLPIYCVDTTEKKISLSFDAACGGGNLR